MTIENPKPSSSAEVELAPLPEQELPLHPDDPLGWPVWRKYYIVILMSCFTLMAQLAPALVNPSFVRVAADLHVTVEEASYSITLFMLFTGVFPIFIAPIANVYGRRPLYVTFPILSFVGFIISATSPSWGGLITGRILSAIGSSIPLGIGAATICDIFSQGERGLPMGIFAWATANGPHIAPIVGGYVAERYGWRWCDWISAIVQGALWVIAVFTFSETLFSRQTAEGTQGSSKMPKMLRFGKVHQRPIRLGDFLIPLKLIKYAAVTLPCIMYMVNLTYGSPLFAVTGSFICANIFHFNLQQTGYWLGVPLTVGCIIGELSAGWVSDLIINTYAKRHDGYRKAEARLFLLPLVLLTAVGTATFGYCIEERRPWIQPAVCMAVSGFGTQVATTVTYTYCCDSYRQQSSDVSIVINLFKARKLLGLPFITFDGFTDETSLLHSIRLQYWVLCASYHQRAGLHCRFWAFRGYYRCCHHSSIFPDFLRATN